MSEQTGQATGDEPPMAMRIEIDPPHEAQRTLADSVRRLAEATVMSDADPAVLLAASERIDEAAEQLQGQRRTGSYRSLSRGEGLPFHYNPVLGPANPYAPPIEVEIVDGEVRGHGTMNEVYEGPPGYVHGGVLSLILDQTLGLANLVAGHPGMTVGLDVRYRRPTPLHRRVEFMSRFSHVDGRSIYCEGTITVDGETTVEATGIFRSITEQRGRQLFAAQLAGDEPSTS